MIFPSNNENKVKYIDSKKILPNRAQPRTEFKDEEILELAESIKENGLLQPVSVRKLSQNRYELISGERRLRAFNLLHISKIPCIILNCDENQSSIFALIENLQRSDLNTFEESEAIYKLMKKLDITQEEIAKKLGKKQSTIANKLRILKLPQEERKQIIENNLTERHARALLKLKEKKDRMKVLNYIIKNQLNVQQSENFIDSFINNKKSIKAESQRKVIIKDVRIFVNTIDKAINTMKSSGIKALTKKNETDEYLEYTVRIPKESAVRNVIRAWPNKKGQPQMDNNILKPVVSNLKDIV